MRRRVSALLLVSFVAFSLAWGQQAKLAPEVPPKPPAAPQRWRALIGEYEGDGATVTVYESFGAMRALRKAGKELVALPVQETNFTRRRNGRTELRAEKKRWRRVIGPGLITTFRLKPQRSIEELRREALAAAPPQEKRDFRKPELVELITLDSTIRLDVRYAGNNNFLSTPFYQQARAFLQRPAAEALVRAHRRLRPLGYGLLIHDAYRPWYVTKMFWEATPQDKKIFVADPQKGSRHNRGGAVDLTLYKLATDEAVEMPSVYDEMSARAYPDYPGGTSLERWHRELLRRVMEDEGFTVYEAEWWHFDWKDWSQYPILNLRFEEISDIPPRIAADLHGSEKICPETQTRGSDSVSLRRARGRRAGCG